MKILDIIVLFVIALAYNIFIHQLAATMFKSMPYDKRSKNTSMGIIIVAILTLIACKLMLMKNNEDYKNNIVYSGLSIGAVILIITMAFTNWDKINDTLKLILISGAFGALVWFAYNKYEEYQQKIELNSLLPE